MAKAYKIYVWKTAPFLRLLLPLITGIILQYYFGFSLNNILIAGLVLTTLLIFFQSLPLAYRFKLIRLQGIFITLFIIITGLFVTRQKDVRNHSAWYGNYCDSFSFIVATISEPPVEKTKSFKALATVKLVINKDSIYTAGGRYPPILFKRFRPKDSSIRR